MIVPGGGLSPDGTRWIACRPGFLLPVRVLSRLFRRLFLEGLSALHGAGKLAFFGDLAGLADAAAFAAWLAQLRKVEWVVYAKPPFGGPEAVLAYLSRYTHRVAISNSRLVSADADTVAFRWKDYRIKSGDRMKVMRLSTDEFIRRFLVHVLPDGFHRIRHYGLLAGAGRKATLARVRDLLGAGAHRGGRRDRHARRPAIEPERTLPRLRWADADHRDVPARRAPEDPGSTTEGCRMMTGPSPPMTPLRTSTSVRNNLRLRLRSAVPQCRPRSGSATLQHASPSMRNSVPPLLPDRLSLPRSRTDPSDAAALSP